MIQPTLLTAVQAQPLVGDVVTLTLSLPPLYAIVLLVGLTE